MLLFVQISLDTEILIAERVVKDAVTLFGDIGGLSGFFVALIGLLVGSIPRKLFTMSATKALFRTVEADLEKQEESAARFGFINYDTATKLRYMVSCFKLGLRHEKILG